MNLKSMPLRPTERTTTTIPTAGAAVVESRVPCMAGYCDRPAVAFVTGHFGCDAATDGRMTVIAGPRGRWLAKTQPDGARCTDHALDELDGLNAAVQPPDLARETDADEDGWCW